MSFNFMAAITIYNDFGEREKKKMSNTASIVFPYICQEIMGPDAMILVFWMLSFKANKILGLGLGFFTLLFHFLP